MSELPLSAAGHRYGYLRDTPDFHDLGMARLTRATSYKVQLSKVDLTKFCGPVKDQKDLGACTAFAGTGMREFIHRRYADFEQTKIKTPPVFSALFLYYKEREMQDSVSDDSGSDGRTSVRAMNQFGVCLESTDPYSTADFRRAPTVAQLAEAERFRAGAYHRIYGVDDMKSCLASQYAFVVGFTVYESFEHKGWTVMPFPTSGEQILGGHEVLFIGYDDKKEAFKVRNSWGADWGEVGDFWFPYQAAANPNILQDAWIQHLGKPW